MIHWELYGNYGLQRTNTWDAVIQCDYLTRDRKPDIVVVKTTERICIIIDIGYPCDNMVNEKEEISSSLTKEIGKNVVWDR